jgi:hypothetical protein
MSYPRDENFIKQVLVLVKEASAIPADAFIPGDPAHELCVKLARLDYTPKTTKKKWSLQCFTGGGSNHEISSLEGTFEEVLNRFRYLYPHLDLDDLGYSKQGVRTYCIAECFNPYETIHRR